jgi:hypothetical protein
MKQYYEIDTSTSSEAYVSTLLVAVDALGMYVLPFVNLSTFTLHPL